MGVKQALRSIKRFQEHRIIYCRRHNLVQSLRLNSHGHIIGTKYIFDFIEKEHEHGHSSHKHNGKEEHNNETDSEALNVLGFDQAAETMIKKLQDEVLVSDRERIKTTQSNVKMDETLRRAIGHIKGRSRRK